MCSLSQSAVMDSTAGTDQEWATEHTGELGHHIACSSNCLRWQRWRMC